MSSGRGELREARRQAVARLVAQREAGQSIRTPLVQRLAADLGVSERTLWRWVSKGSSERKAETRYEPSDLALDLYFEHCGNVAAVHRALTAAGERPPSPKTLQRAFRARLTPAERAYAAEGEAGRRRLSLHRRREVSGRNELWEADHKEMPVQVVPPRGRHPQKVWLTVFLDAYSRAIMGWAVSLQPNAATVLAALEMSVLEHDERGPFAGVPAVLRWDNGLDWLADSVTQAATRLGALVLGTQPYSPQHKGKVERFFRTIDQELISGLPFYTEGPRRANGELYGPDAPPMSLESLIGEVEGYINHYNLERPHSALDGATPRERWLQDATPLDLRSREQLRWLILPRTSRRVHKDGIHFEKLTYFAAELSAVVGERVEVRYMPHDLREIEVWLDDRFLTLAKPQSALDEEEWTRFIGQRQQEAKRAGQLRRRASRRARARLTPITGANEGGDEGLVIERKVAQENSATRIDDGLRGQARAELLDLDEVDMPVDADQDDGGAEG